VSWNKAHIWGLRPVFLLLSDSWGFLMWSALSDERAGLSLTIAVGSRQRCHSRVRVPWDLRPYFTFLDSRLPFLSPPTTRRATVKVFDPAPTRDTVSSTSLTNESLTLFVTSGGPNSDHRLQGFHYSSS
jgi:hypothetical protein